MPVPDQRDSEATRRSLTEWLERHLPGARVPHLETPQTSGFSNETLMFDAEWTGDDGDARRERFVARVAPAGYQVFPEPRFEEQYRLMRVLDRRTGIPVPPIRWYEPSGEVLGAVLRHGAGRGPRPHRHAAVPHGRLGDRGRARGARRDVVVHAGDPRGP